MFVRNESTFSSPAVVPNVLRILRNLLHGITAKAGNETTIRHAILGSVHLVIFYEVTVVNNQCRFRLNVDKKDKKDSEQRITFFEEKIGAFETEEQALPLSPVLAAIHP